MFNGSQRYYFMYTKHNLDKATKYDYVIVLIFVFQNIMSINKILQKQNKKADKFFNNVTKYDITPLNTNLV